MNRENVQIAIDVMRRVEGYVSEGTALFDMDLWGHSVPDTELGASGCGMAACFGGWLARSPEWKAQSGELDCGYPLYKCRVGSDAVAAFLGIDEKTARILTSNRREADMELGEIYARNSPVKPRQVIEQLQHLLDHGTLKFLRGQDV